ncbi:PepSY domain-containing protein [Bradyrhizobium elkanii]|uniref:PepSY domain-containing protein n=1 Tax=Bradyrhizobium elkanii TaxID=29448 RepID=A0A8I1YI01_BRAEL|nr:PepSY domain-containing protein [Bradyrhizobium elkanii]MBP1296748.1 hypothetical protein [Bradyrhizobium elkanii]
MKLAAVFSLCLLALNAVARADQPGADWMPMEQVKAKVLQSGYTQVTKLEADDGRCAARRTGWKWSVDHDERATPGS